MGYMAQWGPKGFLLSPTKVVLFDDFTTSVELKSDSENDTSGTSPINTRGRVARPVEISVTYTRAAGTDPRAQLEEWESLVGEKHPLYIGNKRFGPAYLILKAVSSGDYVFSAKGDILSVTIDISLEEYYDGTNTTTAAQSTAKATTNNTNNSSQNSSQKAAETYQQTVEMRRAMDATASPTDRKQLGVTTFITK